MWPQTHVTSDTHSILSKWKKSNDCHSEANLYCWLTSVTQNLLVKSYLSTNNGECNHKWSTSQLIHAIVVSFFVEQSACVGRRRALTAVGCTERDEFAPWRSRTSVPSLCRISVMHTCQLCWHFCEIVGELSHCLPSCLMWCSQTCTISGNNLIVHASTTRGYKQRRKVRTFTGGAFWLIELQEWLLINLSRVRFTIGTAHSAFDIYSIPLYALTCVHWSKANY